MFWGWERTFSRGHFPSPSTPKLICAALSVADAALCLSSNHILGLSILQCSPSAWFPISFAVIGKMTPSGDETCIRLYLTAEKSFPDATRSVDDSPCSFLTVSISHHFQVWLRAIKAFWNLDSSHVRFQTSLLCKIKSECYFKKCCSTFVLQKNIVEMIHSLLMQFCRVVPFTWFILSCYQAALSLHNSKKKRCFLERILPHTCCIQCAASTSDW